MSEINFFRIGMIVSFIFVSLYIIHNTNSDDFHEETALYAYSAIFQGFAAILAISVTVALVSLQSLAHQIRFIDEEMHEVLEKTVPQYRPLKFMNVEYYIKHEFVKDFRNELRDKPQKTSSQNLVRGINGQLRRMVLFRKRLGINSALVKETFFSSIILSLVVLLFSLSALTFNTPENENKIYFEYADLKINSYTILYCVYVVTVYSLIYSAVFFYRIVHAWVIRFTADPIGIF